ncbi:meiosis protein SPO22/ZIP4 like-domain-containing protein [Pyronema omphalodes]|nr:meiosis protein SPO22/ZIP4 like-domain-containing protein [Pyronema omphalodes]
MALAATGNSIATLHKRLKALQKTTTELCRDLLQNPRSLLETINTNLQDRIEESLKNAEKCVTDRQKHGDTDVFEELDTMGTELWNVVIRVMREIEGKMQGVQMAQMGGRVLKVRLLAFYLLECSQGFSSDMHQNLIRLFKAALKAGRMALDYKELSWTSKVMDRAAQYHSCLLTTLKTLSHDAETTVNNLACEYFTVRLALAWKQNNIPLAEYMFSKATENDLAEVRAAEYTATTAYEIGNEMLGQKNYGMAVKWLERAHDILSRMEPLFLSEAGSELRLPVAHKLATACMKEGTQESLEKAENIINNLSEDWPSYRVSIWRLKIDLILAKSSENPDLAEYAQVVRDMIDVTQLTDTTFKLILHRIHDLVSRKAADKACNCLDLLISKRLLPMEREDWLDKAFVTRLHITVQHQIDREEDAITSTRALLDAIARNLKGTFSPKSTHAAQALLSKVSEALYHQKKYHLASEWCRIALHMAFDRSGELNHAKLSRRILMCCIETKAYGMAAEVYNSMLPSGKNSSRSQFLLLKVALRTSDDDLALSCLTKISSNPETDQQLLYACVLDAQSVGNKKFALQALHSILEKLESLPEEAAENSCILLRSAIRLTMSEIEASRDAKSSIESLCCLYERALQHAKKAKTKPLLMGNSILLGGLAGKKLVFDKKEIDWFSRNGYNLALRGIVEWSPNMALRILNVCMEFMKLYQEDQNTKAEITYRRLLCYYLAATLCIDIARHSDTLEGKLQHYLLTLNHIEGFRSLFSDAEISGSNLCESIIVSEREGFSKFIPELRERFLSLLPFDFESAAKLKKWESLPDIVEEAILLSPPDKTQTLEIMADIVVASVAPGAAIISVLKKIVEYLLMKKTVDFQKTARWVRYAVQFALVRDPKSAEEMLGVAVECARINGKDAYPESELQWLTATTWNKAVDCKCTGDEANAKRLSEIALALAGLLKDPETLRAIQAYVIEGEIRLRSEG